MILAVSSRKSLEHGDLSKRTLGNWRVQICAVKYVYREDKRLQGVDRFVRRSRHELRCVSVETLAGSTLLLLFLSFTSVTSRWQHPGNNCWCTIVDAVVVESLQCNGTTDTLHYPALFACGF